jgi:hypothetical protein
MPFLDKFKNLGVTLTAREGRGYCGNYEYKADKTDQSRHAFRLIMPPACAPHLHILAGDAAPATRFFAMIGFIYSLEG